MVVLPMVLSFCRGVTGGSWGTGPRRTFQVATEPPNAAVAAWE